MTHPSEVGLDESGRHRARRHSINYNMSAALFTLFQNEGVSFTAEDDQKIKGLYRAPYAVDGDAEPRQFSPTTFHLSHIVHQKLAHTSPVKTNPVASPTQHRFIARVLLPPVPPIDTAPKKQSRARIRNTIRKLF
ncbi:Uncharacterized protein PBTT_09635 [Plasmodiophora brassicae]